MQVLLANDEKNKKKINNHIYQKTVAEAFFPLELGLLSPSAVILADCLVCYSNNATLHHYNNYQQ